MITKTQSRRPTTSFYNVNSWVPITAIRTASYTDFATIRNVQLVRLFISPLLLYRVLNDQHVHIGGPMIVWDLEGRIF
jgi:hypothetical protein